MNMQVHNAADEDWELLTTFFPAEWKQLARTTGALKGLRQDKGEENYLRVLMPSLWMRAFYAGNRSAGEAGQLG